MIRKWPRAGDNHPGDRTSDEGPRKPGLWGFLRRYILPATFWSFLASAVAVWAVILHYGDQERIQQGRKAAISVVCAVDSAVSEAGRNVIGNAITLPPATERLLGLPPFHVRQAQAQRQADLYVQAISRAVERQIGHKGDDLVRRDGTLDCAMLQHIAQTR